MKKRLTYHIRREKSAKTLIKTDILVYFAVILYFEVSAWREMSYLKMSGRSKPLGSLKSDVLPKCPGFGQMFDPPPYAPLGVHSRMLESDIIYIRSS